MAWMTVVALAEPAEQVPAQISRCVPSISRSTALPMSCSRPARLASRASTPSSAAMSCASQATSMEWLQHVLAVAGAVLQPAEQLDELGVQVGDAQLQ